MRWFVFVMLAAGCTVQPGSIGWYESTPPAQRKAFFEQHCASYGFKAGTEAMAGCVAEETRDLRAYRAQYYTGLAAN